MSILVFAETSDNQYKKSSLEAVSFAAELAAKSGSAVVAVSIGNAENPALLGEFGANEVLTLHSGEYANFSAEVYAAGFVAACKSKNAHTVIISNTYSGKSIAARVAVGLGASLATNVIDYPDMSNGYAVKRGVFSGKAFAWVNLTAAVKVLAITPNSFEVKKNAVAATVSPFQADAAVSNTQITSVNKVTGSIPLTEAEVVVSGGRGMKGPENWGMIEELANSLGAATACSKPVSDMHWRPHSEHVGQTGITIKPNLYIAIGISGAIQHLAGVSSSKVIVVINKDPEAPFFKAADYGIVGDAFEVLPKLIEAAKSTSAHA
jgi:electron transfer flavoprotein alpha subunit